MLLLRGVMFIVRPSGVKMSTATTNQTGGDTHTTADENAHVGKRLRRHVLESDDDEKNDDGITAARSTSAKDAAVVTDTHRADETMIGDDGAREHQAGDRAADVIGDIDHAERRDDAFVIARSNDTRSNLFDDLFGTCVLIAHC